MPQSRCPSCHACFLPEAPNPAHCPTCGAFADPAIWRGLRIVSMRWRFLASLIDHALFFALWWGLAALLRQIGSVDLSGASRWAAFVQTLLYFGFFAGTTWGWGGSPAKRALGIVVVRAEDARPITLLASVLREILGRAVCLFLAPIGYATVISRHSRLQTLADILAKTIVVWRIPQK